MTQATDYDDLMDQLGLNPDGTVKEPAPEVEQPKAPEVEQPKAPEAEQPKAPLRPFQSFGLSELLARPLPAMVIPDVMPEGFVEMLGKPGTFKSFVAAAFTTSVSGKQPSFLGFPLNLGGRCLYLATEGSAGMARRVNAFIENGKLKLVDFDNQWRMVQDRIDLNDQKSIDAFLKENPGPWAVITIDTLAQNMSGDENGTQDMNEVVKACKYIRKHLQPGGVLLLLHHEGRKNSHGRGSIALDAATDCQLRMFIDKDSGLICLQVARLREQPLPNPQVVARFKIVDGALVRDDAPRGAAKLRGREQKMREHLVALCKGGPISKDQFKKSCELSGFFDGNTEDTRKHQWQRAIEKMTDEQCIKLDGRMISPCEPPPPSDFDDAPAPEDE